MTDPASIREIRGKLGFSQALFAQLLGVHSMTISRWERGVGKPPFSQGMWMLAFKQACERQPDIGKWLAGVLVEEGVPKALFCLLDAAFKSGRSV